MNRYFYIDSEGKQKGTFSPEELKIENINKDTLVWTQGMNEWLRAGSVAELEFIFAQSAGNYPPQYPQQPVAPQAPQASYSAAQQQQVMPKSWLIESILVTVLPFLLCSSIFSLLGIIGIVNASKVESLFMRGDYAGSQEASKQAGRWTKIAMWIAIGWIVLWVLAIIIIITFGVSMASVSDIVGSSGYEI